MKKKLISLILISSMVLSLAACGSKSEDPKTDSDLTQTTNDSTTDTTEEDNRDYSVYEIVSTRAYDYNFDELTAQEFAAALGVGWNLGNTLDATGGDGTDPIKQETSWGNPEISQELIQEVADLGFTTIRIPITWAKFVDDDYNIDEAMLERVKQVVDWSLEEGLFVIINTHHDTGGDGWLIPDEAHYDEVSAKLCAMWTQIAEYFADYDERLIFEGMNEPRVGDNWNGTTSTIRVVNQLGLDFVDTIRQCSGYNQTRYLMVPCYAATSNSTVWSNYEWPDDDRVLLSIHAYLPYDFALNTAGTDQFDSTNSADTVTIDTLFKNINDIILRSGHACVIGEMGCMAKNNNLDARIDCATYFAQKAAFYKVPFLWWDNNAFTSGETFGLIRRSFNDCLYTGIVEGMLNAWYDSDFHFNS
jgi:endoglucanase